MQKIKSEDYVMKFGIYKGMKAVDVASLTKEKTNKKGETFKEKTGLNYLKFLTEQEWFKHSDIINEIIKKVTESN